MESTSIESAKTGRSLRPVAIAFDVIGTLFSTQPLANALTEIGLPEFALKLWFARFLRDAFALDLAGTFKPFREVAIGALIAIARAEDVELDETKAVKVIEQIPNLPLHEDVKPAFELLRQSGLRLAALTNGSEATTRQMLAHAGLADRIESFISIDEVQHWKPRREVYLHAARKIGVEPATLALVAAHDWDIEGAMRAGLTAAAVRRKSLPFSPAMRQPTVSADSLTEMVQQLLKLSSG